MCFHAAQKRGLGLPSGVGRYSRIPLDVGIFAPRRKAFTVDVRAALPVVWEGHGQRNG